MVAIESSKVGIAGVLLQEESNGHLRPCAYRDRKLQDAETRYSSAYNKETLAIVEAVSRVWSMYLLGCECFLVVKDHAILVHLFKLSSDKLTDRQTHWVIWVEALLPYANLMRIVYRTGNLTRLTRCLDVPISSLLITCTCRMKASSGMEKCPTLILMVMALHYWHYQHWNL